ncbi:MAG TPA: biotin--[acetyl-CoA-carboxylase] ligase [Burkholderiaceae bacterium]
MSVPLFSAEQLTAQVAGLASPPAIEVVQETGSTNADLLARLPQLQGPVLRVAEQQTAGRGRAGRTWISQAGASITFSLAWRLRGPLPRLLGLPLAVGVALADAFGDLGVQVQLKWPNDLFKDGKKLGGILIETAAAPDGVWAVIGIGINLLLPDELEARIGRAVADAPWLAQLDRNVLLGTLARHLCATLDQFDDTGFAPFAPRWNAVHAHRGSRVAILEGERALHEGIATGVDDTGRLLLATGTGEVAVTAGDVSLRERPAAR